MELQEIITNGNGQSTHLSNKREYTVNGDGGAAAAEETDGLLTSVQTTGSNGTAAFNPAAENHGNVGNTNTPQTNNLVGRVKNELNELIFWKVRLWMIIVFIFVLIIAVILISLHVCSGIHKDADENYDSSLFIVPLYFNGSFKLPNLVFTEKLFTLSSNEGQTLAADFQKKLTDLYKSSPALERYFSEAKINAFRNGSVIADYQLTFLMPKEGQDQLRNFTLSREMVYNVFRQFLYDQELDKTEPMYINPVSLTMFLG